jgi:hypothetical protein
MPFGLRNAPGTFQRLADKLLSGCENFAAAYLDDIVIYSNSWQDHIKHTRRVFNTIRGAGLTLIRSKCVFANASVEYLGHGHVVGVGRV